MKKINFLLLAVLFAVVSCSKDDPSGPSVQTPEEVDLGLSVKWASFNLGATKPEECGRYFSWGSVAGQTWNGSKWSGGGFSVWPAFDVDETNNLKSAYDAACVLLGGSWRMPTKAEMQELINNCTCTYETVNGVSGRRFTSKKAGYGDKSIFLPYSGCGSDSADERYLESYGYYWSSSFDSGKQSWHLFLSGNTKTENNASRKSGFPVRPVSE